MDDTVAEELRFHQQTVSSDGNSPLHLIREKELEISGRMLAAKRNADEIVADARRKAAEVIGAAHDEAGELALARDKVVRAEVEQQVAQINAQAEREAAEMASTIAARKSEAVAMVIDAVLGR